MDQFLDLLLEFTKLFKQQCACMHYFFEDSTGTQEGYAQFKKELHSESIDNFLETIDLLKEHITSLSSIIDKTQKSKKNLLKARKMHQK